MDVSRPGVDKFRKGIDVGAEKLFQTSVFQNTVYYLVLAAKLLQHFLARHILSRLGLLGLIDNL